ncbi:hypothetical protein RHSIM_Rhsim04G0079900 [Rhododendron simsii]|uniref:UBN2_2 domain-containing protein n=1 Tax=Rhododendron simsii TaxID=118357 RepID=A0A834LP75_RHOSS|nr:hypothetical protein RHSIM_Rhsim04G0079900 [Rhododendron simsii]
MVYSNCSEKTLNSDDGANSRPETKAEKNEGQRSEWRITSIAAADHEGTGGGGDVLANEGAEGRVTLVYEKTVVCCRTGLHRTGLCYTVQVLTALRCEKPAALTDKSSAEAKSLLEAWERSNRLGLMFMRMTIANNIKTTLPDAEDAKVYLTSIETRFKQADKSLAGTLMAKLTTMKHDGSHGMHEHVLEMTNLAAQLKNLGMSVDEFFLVQFVLNSLSLSPQYEPFQINYNTMKDKWNLNELASMLVQEEARLKQSGQHLAHLTY